jgi:hypothetical protein
LSGKDKNKWLVCPIQIIFLVFGTLFVAELCIIIFYYVIVPLFVHSDLPINRGLIMQREKTTNRFRIGK